MYKDMLCFDVNRRSGILPAHIALELRGFARKCTAKKAYTGIISEAYPGRVLRKKTAWDMANKFHRAEKQGKI